MKNEFGQVLTEVNEILKISDENIVKKIPYEFRKMVVQNMDKTYISNIQFGKPLEEQNIKSKTRDMLALIFKNYIVSEEEKNKMIEIENELTQYKV